MTASRTIIGGIALVACVVGSLLGAPLHAQLLEVPISGPVDPRVRSVLFKEDAVVSLRGHYGYQMSVEFGADERIENVSIGDSLAWQVTPNRRADTIFLKPIEFDATTNMSVITNKRRYTFQLSAEAPEGPGDPNIIYRVKFTYPPEVATTPVPTVLLVHEAVNRAYSVSGSVRNRPSQVYDDGALTYFEWPAATPTPAVFAVGTAGGEAVVNFTMRGNLMVVERIAPAFVLRNGSDETRVSNNGWREPEVGPSAPVVTAAPPPSRTNTARPSFMQRMFGPRTSKAGGS
jgi:type IV secretion system protein VirB9